MIEGRPWSCYATCAQLARRITLLIERMRCIKADTDVPVSAPLHLRDVDSEGMKAVARLAGVTHDDVRSAQ